MQFPLNSLPPTEVDSASDGMVWECLLSILATLPYHTMFFSFSKKLAGAPWPGPGSYEPRAFAGRIWSENGCGKPSHFFNFSLVARVAPIGWLAVVGGLMVGCLWFMFGPMIDWQTLQAYAAGRPQRSRWWLNKLEQKPWSTKTCSERPAELGVDMQRWQDKKGESWEEGSRGSPRFGEANLSLNTTLETFQRGNRLHTSFPANCSFGSLM